MYKNDASSWQRVWKTQKITKKKSTTCDLTTLKKEKKSLLIFWFVSSPDCPQCVYAHKEVDVSQYRENPYIHDMPNVHQASSRHFECIISESHNNPAKKIHIKY